MKLVIGSLLVLLGRRDRHLTLQCATLFASEILRWGWHVWCIYGVTIAHQGSQVRLGVLGRQPMVVNYTSWQLGCQGCAGDSKSRVGQECSHMLLGSCALIKLVSNGYSMSIS